MVHTTNVRALPAAVLVKAKRLRYLRASLPQSKSLTECAAVINSGAPKFMLVRARVLCAAKSLLRAGISLAGRPSGVELGPFVGGETKRVRSASAIFSGRPRAVEHELRQLLVLKLGGLDQRGFYTSIHPQVDARGLGRTRLMFGSMSFVLSPM